MQLDKWTVILDKTNSTTNELITDNLNIFEEFFYIQLSLIPLAFNHCISKLISLKLNKDSSDKYLRCSICLFFGLWIYLAIARAWWYSIFWWSRFWENEDFYLEISINGHRVRRKETLSTSLLRRVLLGPIKFVFVFVSMMKHLSLAFLNCTSVRIVSMLAMVMECALTLDNAGRNTFCHSSTGSSRLLSRCDPGWINNDCSSSLTLFPNEIDILKQNYYTSYGIVDHKKCGRVFNNVRVQLEDTFFWIDCRRFLDMQTRISNQSSRYQAHRYICSYCLEWSMCTERQYSKEWRRMDSSSISRNQCLPMDYSTYFQRLRCAVSIIDHCFRLIKVHCFFSINQCDNLITIDHSSTSIDSRFSHSPSICVVDRTILSLSYSSFSTMVNLERSLE